MWCLVLYSLLTSNIARSWLANCSRVENLAARLHLAELSHRRLGRLLDISRRVMGVRLMVQLLRQLLSLNLLNSCFNMLGDYSLHH